MNLYDLIVGNNKQIAIQPITIYYFKKNKDNMEKLPNMDKKDKYFHALSNCQAGQNFDIFGAMELSLGKEIWDIAKKNGWKKNGYPLKFNLIDSWQDLGADMYGLGQGLLHPFSDCRTLLDRYKPEQLKDTNY